MVAARKLGIFSRCGGWRVDWTHNWILVTMESGHIIGYPILLFKVNAMTWQSQKCVDYCHTNINFSVIYFSVIFNISHVAYIRPKVEQN